MTKDFGSERRGRPEVPVSVVISTMNRAQVLRNALKSLQYQDYDNFEVIVVNGPSVDETEEILAEYQGRIKVGRLAEANLSKSRNIGISLSSGNYVLFLDDDAFAEPSWISNIVEAYQDDTVGAVGTRVYDHTGFNWQLNPFLIDKYYLPDFKRQPPLWAFEFRDSEVIPHILGASSSFRRDLLSQIGGFDEEIEYFLDESELCRRIAESGHKVRFVDKGASVLHKFAAGVTRDERRLLTHPYPVVKNKYYVSLSDWRRNGGALTEVLRQCDKWLAALLEDARWQVDNHGISIAEYDKFVADVERGRKDGRERGMAQARKSIEIAPADPANLLRFPKLEPVGGRKTFCFVSRWTPDRSPGGIARYMWDLANGFADAGHEVHLITATEGPATVDFEDGLWIRRLPEETLLADNPLDPAVVEVFEPLKSGAAQVNLAWAKAAHREVLRIRGDRYIDLVAAPVWDQEGLYCVLDKRLQTLISMNTTFKRYAGIEWNKIAPETIEELTALEDIYVTNCSSFHANSQSSADHLADAFGMAGRCAIEIVPHGIADIDADELKAVRKLRAKAKGNVELLYVSRLEKRKGTDLFLQAVAKLARQFPDLVVNIVGRDPYEATPAQSYRALFEKQNKGLASRVVFHGELSDEELAPLYASADIFCVPSRYESFGIVFVEAMRYELPVVALGVGGATDIVVDGVTGRLVEGENPQRLEAALAELIANPETRRAMAKKGRERFEAMFEHETVVRATMAAFLRLAARAGGATLPAVESPPPPTTEMSGMDEAGTVGNRRGAARWRNMMNMSRKQESA